MTTPTFSNHWKSHSDQLAEEDVARQKRRNLARDEQQSDLNPPERRISLWERAHELRMPSDPKHPVLDVIANDTCLTLAQIREEQRLRGERKPNGGRK